MKRIFLFLSLVAPVIAISQQTITGSVYDALSNQPLAHASIADQHNNSGTSAGNDGKFTLHVSENTKAITVSYVGYESVTVNINPSTTDYAIGLRPLQNQQELVVIGTRNLSRTNVQTPVPIDIIPVAILSKEIGQTDLNQLLSYTAPSFQSSRQNSCRWNRSC